MKKCSSCAKDLPDAALHCVFCGAKQAPAAPPAAGANAKTVMGWQASDLMKDMANKGVAPAPGVAMPPPAAPPPAAPPAMGNLQTLAAPPPAAPPGMGNLQTLAAPPGVGNMQTLAAPGQAQAPNAAAAKTVFAAQAPSMPAPSAYPPSPTMPAPSAYGPGPGAAAFPPAPTMPAPSAYGGPGPVGSPAANAKTMFAGPGGPQPMPGGPMGQPPGAGMPPTGQMPGAGMPPMGQMPGAGMPPMGQMPGAGMPPMGPMPGAGMPPMGPMPGAGMPPMGPMPGAGMPPAYQPPMPPQQPMAPPYLASRTAARAGAPREPYADGMRLVLLVFGALLIAAFVAPLSVGDKIVFRWSLLSGNGGAVAKFDHIYLAAAGVLAVVFGAIALANVPRGLLALLLGLVPIALHFVVDDIKDAKEIRWQEIVEFVGVLTLVPGLLLRHEYRSQMLPRILVTVGALCVLLPLLIPEGGKDPAIKALIDGISAAKGKAKVGPILALYPVVLAALSLLCWLPAPTSAGAKVIAWLFITSAVVSVYTLLLVNGHIGDAVKRNFASLLLGGWVAAAFSAFVGYGMATLIGKNLEH